MHIVVTQGAQRLNSQVFRGFDAEQIDLFLNRAQDVCFDEYYSPMLIGGGVEQSRKRMGQLANLTEDHYGDSCIIAGSGNPEYLIGSVPSKFKMTLPIDCVYVQSVRPKISYDLCNDFSFTTSTSNLSVAVLPFETDPDITGLEQLTSVDVTIQTTGADQDYDDVPRLVGYPNWDRYYFPEDGQALIYHLVRAIDFLSSQNGYRVVYEAYKGLFFPGSILVVHDGGGLPGVSKYAEIVLSGIDDNGDATTYTMRENYNTTFDYSSVGVITPTDYDEKNTLGTLRRHIESELVLNNAFLKSRHDDVLVFTGEKYLNFYTDGTFTVDEAVISYIRRPRQMSLALGQSCELNVSLHRKICDLAIGYLTAVGSRSNYQQLTMETEKAG